MSLPIPSSGNGFEGAILQKSKHADEQKMLGGILRKPARVSRWRKQEMGVDELAEKVGRVTELLKLCRDRLYKTEENIDKILNPDP